MTGELALDLPATPDADEADPEPDDDGRASPPLPAEGTDQLKLF